MTSRNRSKDIDVFLATKQSQMFQFVLHFKENMVNGVSRGPSIMFEL